MKQGHFFLSFILFLSCCSLFAQTQLANSPTRQFTSYRGLWKKVDSLSKLGLPKSALFTVNKIYEIAKAEKNDPQYIKAVLFRLKLKADFEEGPLTTSIKELKSEIKGSREPAKQILYSILAEVYQTYYQDNRYRFDDRTQVLNNNSDSIQTWDLKTLTRHSVNAWLHSLQNPVLLQSIPIGSFEEILTTDGNPGENAKKSKNINKTSYRPTLYDLLAWRALDYFTENVLLDKTYARNFTIHQESYFRQAREFGELKLELPRDTSSLLAYAVELYHDLARFHTGDKDPKALIDEEIHRFLFLKQNAVVTGKDSLYFDGLTKLEQQHLTSPSSTDITYYIASYYKEKGDQYRPAESQKHKWELKKAVECCDQAITRFPQSNGAKNCKFMEADIRKPSLEVETGYAVVPDKPELGVIAFKNVNKLFFRLAKTDPDVNKDNTLSRTREDLVKYYSTLPYQKNWSLKLINDGDFHSHRIEIRIPEEPAGFYVLIASSDSNFKDPCQVIAWTQYFSTQISYLSHRVEKGAEEFYILDRETGIPLKDVVAEVYTNVYTYQKRKSENKKVGEYVTDENGHFLLPGVSQNVLSNNVFLRLKLKDDLFITKNYYQYPVNEGEKGNKLKTFFFTDRAIYRPGQTVYFKGIILEVLGDKYSIIPDQETTVTFNDVNGQKIATQTFTANEFSSFNGSFVIPQGLLNGEMTLSNSTGSISFSVEEYKRPTFEVSFDPLEGNYRLNDTVTLNGKATGYAGNNIDGAAVKFRVVRSARFPFWDFWWYPMPSVPETEIVNGIVKTQKNGSFMIRFQAIPDLSVDKSISPVFDYVIYADVTDINGETQSANESVSAGYVSLLLGLNIPDKLDPSRDTLYHLSATNLNGRKTPTTVTVTIQQLHQPERVFRKKEWAKPDLFGMTEKDFHASFPNDVYSDEDVETKWKVEKEIWKKDINTGTDSIIRFSQIAKKMKDGEWRMEDGSVLQPGNYMVTLNAKDPYGEAVEQKIPFVIYNINATVMPVQEIDWFVPIKTNGEPGEKAVFLIGSKAENVNVLYEIIVHDTLYSRQWLKLSNNQRLVEIPIKEGYRGNFSVNFSFVRYNRTFQHSASVCVPYTNKKLDIKFETFRDKLNPGQNEEWKIRIADEANKGVKSEYLTAMYDASLDVFATNTWPFSILHDYYSSFPWEFGGFQTTSGQYFPLQYSGSEYFKPVYEELNLFGFELSGGEIYDRSPGLFKKGSMIVRFTAPMVTEDSANAREEGIANVVVTKPATHSFSLDGKSDVAEKTGNKNASPLEKNAGVQVRRNFQETAFFFPSLVTDSVGNLDVKFTLPESLTKWKVLGLAYTKDLKYGSVERELITHKDLMVFPNAPRFVRQGDTLVFSSNVVNLSDHSLTGEVSLELSDALTQKPFDILISQNQKQDFTINTGQSSAVQWKMAIPQDPSSSVLQYRIIAKAGEFSDGEEQAFPVLPNRMMVTESLPLPVRGKGPLDFKFDKLLNSSASKTLKNYKLTLEFASNPVWYAVQALPTMDDPLYPNADNIFRTFYTNSIASFLAKSNPAIKQVFESWTTLSKDALVSNLMKNESLKTALLQETPWVMEAQDETQRKHRLGLFFDKNNLELKLMQNLKKLQKMQTSSGGWPWFDGMQQNRYITQEIIIGLGHLDHLGVKNIREDKDTWNMLIKAIAYLDGEIVNDYNDVKKYSPKKMGEDHLGSTQIQYLYARSYFLNDIPLKDGNLKTAFQYYQAQAEKYWLQNDIYMQGMIALSLHRIGNKNVPAAILKSLSEKAIHSVEMGMYWASEGGYEWYQAPIETHSLLIEAYTDISQDTKPVDEMKVWLLKQKQTQDWKTGSATAEACYALLLRGTDLLSEQPEVKIMLGKETIEPNKLTDTKVEAGTGYFQVYRDSKEISPEMGNVTVSKSNEGVAWGALYWQYFEDLDKITPHQTPLKIEKKLFIERITPSGKVLVPITNYELGITKGGKGSNGTLKVGDKVIVRIILSVDRNLEFVHMKDMRASAFEPPTSEQMSGYQYRDGLGYYQSTTDVATNFFFDYLPKGTWVFEYPLLVNAAGEFSNGITTAQCMYAPEFGAHSEGLRVAVGY